MAAKTSPEFSTGIQSPASLAIPELEDDASIRAQYRPFLLAPETTETDWISRLELVAAMKTAQADLQQTGTRLRILVLFGSLRKR
jgi:arsenic resistance protein ArsH